MAKSSTFVMDRLKKILSTNRKGDKQFGLRDQHKELKKKIGPEAADAWLRTHIERTLQFRELLAREDWVVSDTETTSVGASAEICELAFVPSTKLNPYSTFIKPTRSITDGSAAVHGITNSMVADAPTFPQVVGGIQRALKKYAAVVWYNGEFDIRIFEQTCYEHDLPFVEWPEHIDVMPWFAEFIGDWNSGQVGFRWPKLEGGHRAEGDCIQLIEAIELAATSNIEYAELLLSGEEK